MKFSFFAKLYLAITDFRLYPYVVQKEKLKNAFSYFLTFVLLISVILSITSMIKITNWLNEFLIEYQEQINAFHIEDGTLTVDENMNIDFLRVKIYTDDTHNFDEVDLKLLDLDNYKAAILAFKDTVAIGNNRYAYTLINYKESNMNINKQELFTLLMSVLQNPVYKVSFIIILMIGMFIVFFVSRLFYVLLITFMLMLLGMTFRLKYKFKDYMKVAFYVITLPTITEIIALVCVGELNDYATITYYLLCYVYMFYAVRALKLDNILTATQEKIMSLKTESEKANSVLEKEKASKDNKEVQENKKEESKDNQEDNNKHE